MEIFFIAARDESSVITLTDLNGTIVYNGTVSGTSAKINISAFQTGIYIVKVNNSQISSIAKHIVE